MSVQLEPTSAEFRHDAVNIYRRLLREQPVLELTDNRYLLCRHADVRWALRDHERVVRPTQWSSDRKPAGPFREFGRNNMISMNPPDHTRFRKAIMRAFAPAQVSRLQSFIEATCDRLIDGMAERGCGDFIDDFAYPLPVAVICSMLGIPDTNRDLLRSGSASMLAGLELSASAEELQRAASGAQDLFDYLRELVDQRADDLGDDLLSLLIRHEQEDQLTRDEVVWAAITLLLAGHETTTHLLGNGLLALIHRPDEYERLYRERSWAGNAVEEFLRFDPSLYVLYRQAARPLDMDGVAIPEGAILILSLAAANRDPRVFDEPDSLDISRPNADQHLAFADGRHLCAGHAVARLEGRIAFDKLVSRLHDFELDGVPAPREGLMFKGYHSLPVRYRSRV
ncbi:MAG: cytochrome P450 [Gammaproteobacteria bacterium]|nr:cytochrome P450 [Gammaproteobacteria bacterium]